MAVGASEYQIGDRYRRDDGRVFMSGSQALARLPLEQLRADRDRGWMTAAYVTGYPGSPLAGYDRDAGAAARAARDEGLALIFQPALNEELAATAVMGSQLAVTVEGCRYDGVIGLWYGKAPGLDRASDAVRHAVFAGTGPRSGAVALVGDDPAAKSSTLPSSSDANLVDLHIPIIHPGDVQEALDLGRHAIAMSRASGLWTSLKIVAAVADGTGTVELSPTRVRPLLPEFEVGGRPFVPHPDGRLVTPYTLELEREFHEVRLRVAQQYGVVNHLNTIPVRTDHDWIGIAASGHTYAETLEALRALGLRTPDDLRAAGVRLLKLSMPVPLDPYIVREFAAGLSEIFVVEEKNPTLEWLVKDALYDQAQRPIVTGKRDPDGGPLLPVTGAMDADAITPRLRARLSTRLADRLAPPPPAPRPRIPLSEKRTPYFCSGCPHNTSTKVPDGELVGGGIGCHSMVVFMEEPQVGHIVSLTAMGNEGAQWFGMAPFVDRPHMVQNIGDGTLFHSGMLAVRAAVANGANITYKVLYNGAVAMTGGQDPFGQLSVPNLVTVFLAEGVRQVLITTDDLERYRRVSLPPGVDVWDRTRIVEAQARLAKVPGTTVLIHDQRCAAEKRRDRKRGVIARPKELVLINERVCEGCGDCGATSNCLSVQPVTTPFGRKTRIDQTTCNVDQSCLEGDCPSFATVVPKRRASRRASKRALPSPASGLPDPTLVVPADECTIRMSGIGGTGVVTLSQIVGTAAMIDGYSVRGLDQTGLSQKAGPVVSDLRLSRSGPLPSNKAMAGAVDTLLALDLLVATSDAHVVGASAGRTVVIASSSPTPTGTMVQHPDRPYPDRSELEARVAGSSRVECNRYVDAAGLCRDLLGDATAANVLVLGVAVQAGAVPVSSAAVERAIELNGVAVEVNLAAFRIGRQWAVDPASVGPPSSAEPVPVDLVERLAADLVGYQNRRWAERYRVTVAAVEAAEREVVAGTTALRDAVAVNLHKLMAYKDEYEVARLLLAPEARAAVEAVAGPGARVSWKLHPPVFRSLGVHRKITLGRWAVPALWALRSSRWLRGTWLDPFGRARVRRLERALVPEYEAAIGRLLAGLTVATHAEAVSIAELPDSVRGYEHLKLSRAADYRVELERRLGAYGVAAPALG